MESIKKQVKMSFILEKILIMPKMGKIANFWDQNQH